MTLLEQNFQHRHLKGICLVLLGFLCTSFISAIGKILIDQIPLGMLLFTQNTIAFILYFLLSVLSLKSAFKTNRFSLHLFRALMGLGSYICLFLAIQHIPLVNATLLANSTPLFLPLIIFIWFHQKISKALWLCLLIGFIGVFCIVNPTGGISSLVNSRNTLVALLGSVLSALALQGIRYLGTTEKPNTINLYYFGISSLGTAPWAATTWKSLEPCQWFYLSAMGLFLMLTQLFLAHAYRFASPTTLGPFNYSIVIFSGILGWIFWGELPTIMDSIGVVLISLGGILSMTKFVKGSVWDP